jgi:hypothetical protein
MSAKVSMLAEQGEDMTERLPCPFCGHVGVTHNEGLTFRWLTTECNGCGAQCAEERINTMTMERSAAIEQAKVEALKTWNTRFTPFPPQQQAEPVSMRMPKVGDRVICLEDESFGEVVSLTGGGSPDINFDDGTRGTYLLREFAELFGYAEQRQQQAEPPPEWLLIKNILDEYGLQAIDFVAEFKAAQQVATIWKQAKPFSPEAINTTQTAWRMGYKAAKAEQQQAEPVAWDKPSDNFNEWWNGDYEDPANPFEKDSAAYWAWAGWQAAQRPWVGLTDEDWEQIHDRKDTSLDTFEQGAVWAANQLKERNT